MAKRKYVYDYYDITLPGDMFESLDEFAEQAITQAEDQVRLDAIPCDWKVTTIDGDIGDVSITFRIRRRRSSEPLRV